MQKCFGYHFHFMRRKVQKNENGNGKGERTILTVNERKAKNRVRSNDSD